MENELVPVLSGVLAGLVLGGLTARQRPLAWVLLSFGLGLAATVVTGEFRISWVYLVVDIPLVAAVSAGAFVVTRAARRRQLRLA